MICQSGVMYVLVWCVILDQLHPSPGPSSRSRAIAPYSPALARRFVAVLTTESAPRELNGTMPTSAGDKVVVGTTPLQPALVPSWHPRELPRVHTPLRSSTFD